MAPIGEAYFPPLDRCFSGDYQLLSWETCYIALSQLGYASNGGSLKRFLTDPQTIDLLVSSLAPYSPSSSQSKSSFETKTSAINVTPPAHARYNIKHIRDDALWLSNETDIDEVSALRIAILEWQTRPAACLLWGSTAVPVSSSNGIDGTYYGGGLMQENYGSIFAPSALEEPKSPDKRNELLRKRRLVDILLSERRYILKCSEYILAHALCTADYEDVAGSHASEEKKPRWLRAIGLELLANWAPENARNGKRRDNDSNFINNAVAGIRARLEALRGGSGWSEFENTIEEVDISWGSNQIIEAIHIMQIVQDLLQSSATIVQAEVILPWFRLIAECGFFDRFHLPYPEFQTVYNTLLQSLAALVSLTILNVSATLELLTTSSAASLSASSSMHPVPYILNQPAANEINDLLISVAPIAAASPSVLGWSIITQNLREIALATRDSRELRQSVRAADKYGAADSSDTDGAERLSLRGMSVIRRRSSTSSDTSQQSTLLEEINDSLQITPVDGDPVAYLAKTAVEGGKVFEVLAAIATAFCAHFGFEHNGVPDQKMRQCLLDLIRACVEFVEYQPALIMATTAIVSGVDRYWDRLDRPNNAHTLGPAVLLRQDKILKRRILLVALFRFPYETMPLLQLCRAMAYQHNADAEFSDIGLGLQELDTFTCMLPLDFQGYKTIREDEEADFIELLEDYKTDMNANTRGGIPQISENSSLLRSPNLQASPSSSFCLPRGTQGQILSNGKPLVVAWNYDYSGLTYIGRVLQFASSGTLSNESSSTTISSNIVAEAISFITSILSSATKNSSAQGSSATFPESATSILGQASDGLHRNQDVISVIWQIFENELYKQRKPVEDLDSLDVMVQCVHFAHALLPIIPDRVWPFLGRSGLLGIGGEVERLSAVVTSYELVEGRYEFLLGCIRVYDALIEDVVLKAVSRKKPIKAITRFGTDNTLGSGISDLVMENVLLSFQRIMMDVFGSIGTWRFISEDDRAEIGSWLCSIFEKLLDYSFSINDDPNISSRLNSALLPAANIMLDVYLTSSKTDLAINPLLQVCYKGLNIPSTSLPSRGEKHYVAQSVSAIRLLYTVIRASVHLKRSLSHLEEHLFKAAGLFTRMYTAHQAYKLPVMELFDALVRSASSNQKQPPSLLGQLGQKNTDHFLRVLSAFDQPMNDDTLAIAIWRFLAAIVSKRQQSFAHFVLTGVSPSTSVKTKQNPPVQNADQPEPVLSSALEKLRSIDKLEPKKALAMLELVTLAADYWPFALTAIGNHPDFLQRVSEYASRIGSLANSGGTRSNKALVDYNDLRITSRVVDILAMYTHRTQQEGNPKFARMLIPHLNYILKNAITTPSYNTSLHNNLQRNFAIKFQGCNLIDFKRTSMARASLGDSYYYDMDLANKMLKFEPAWAGRRGQGFAEEVRRANSNFSVVEAQVELFHSWKSLLIELSADLATEESFQRIMAQSAVDCLTANTGNSLPEAFFERLAQSRVDLAFTMLESLNEVKSNVSKIRAILPVAWNALRSHSADLGSALQAHDADYHRILLKLLYLTIQLHTSQEVLTPDSMESANKTPPDSWAATANATTSMVLEIISTTVAQGFRSLTILIHDSPHLVHPSDFAFLTALLRSCLQIPGVTRNSEHLLNAFADTQIPRCAATLLSWSDQLASSTSGDPVYGELSILFLLELSTVPALAESLAVDGILPHILTTNIFRLLQNKGFGPSDHPSRMYAMWSYGLLPLLLNLLHAVGPPMAAEVAAALNAFPHQLRRASDAFSSPSSRIAASDPTYDYITLAMAQEAHSLALLSGILRTFREAGASAAVIASEVEEVNWDAAQVREDVEGWLERRVALRERIMPSNEREESWSRMKPVKEGLGENRLEERVLRELRGVVSVLGNGEE